MIDLKTLKLQLGGKPIAIVGLARSGIAAYEACKAAGIATVLWDDNESARKPGLPVEDLREADFSRFGLLCLAPGIPFTHPAPHPCVAAAQRAGCPVVCDIELFHRAHADTRTIGITGTNGKSTTTALIGHILTQAGVECAVGGNIGDAALGLPQLSSKGTYVFEMSSYQIDLCPTFAPDIAILINISPDHLDRHGGMEGYVKAKRNIFRGAGTAVIGVDDTWAADMHDDIVTGARNVIPIALADMPDGMLHGFDLTQCRALQGEHNWQNAAMAYAACKAAGLTHEQITAGLKSFPGLAHRQNIVARHSGVTYINDSKATNDQAAAMALRTFKPVYWIAGGKAKDGGYPDCEKYLRHVRHAFLIGEATEKMAGWLTAKGAPFTRCGTMDKAVAEAKAMAEKECLRGATVLLSPACASFDQFRDFEQRGRAFEDLVREALA